MSFSVEMEKPVIKINFVSREDAMNKTHTVKFDRKNRGSIPIYSMEIVKRTRLLAMLSKQTADWTVVCFFRSSASGNTSKPYPAKLRAFNVPATAGIPTAATATSDTFLAATNGTHATGHTTCNATYGCISKRRTW